MTQKKQKKKNPLTLRDYHMTGCDYVSKHYIKNRFSLGLYMTDYKLFSTMDAATQYDEDDYGVPDYYPFSSQAQFENYMQLQENLQEVVYHQMVDDISTVCTDSEVEQ